MDQLAIWPNYFGVPAAVALRTIVTPIVAILVIVVVNRAVGRLMYGVQPRLNLPLNIIKIVTRTIAVLFWICAVLLILDTWGVGVNGLWTVLVSMVTAIGVGFLAVWTMVSNVTASLFITIWRPFHLGETIEILPEGLRGRVTDRNLMFTVLREGEGQHLHIPNNFFFQKIFRVGEARELAVAGHVDRVDEPAAAGRRAA